MPRPLRYPFPLQRTEPEVFIIESLSVADEIRGRFEGKALRDTLRISGQRPAYYYVTNAAQLAEAAEKFRHSGYRFLHVSAHGNTDGVATTLEMLTNQEFAEIFAGKLKNRRLFFSACEIGSGALNLLIQGGNKGMYSIAAPLDRIPFGTACAFWTAFYTRVLTDNPLGMEADALRPALHHLCQFFSIRLNWSYYRAGRDDWSAVELR